MSVVKNSVLYLVDVIGRQLIAKRLTRMAWEIIEQVFGWAPRTWSLHVAWCSFLKKWSMATYHAFLQLSLAVVNFCNLGTNHLTYDLSFAIE